MRDEDWRGIGYTLTGDMDLSITTSNVVIAELTCVRSTHQIDGVFDKFF
jgi:hypothetical protein